MKVTVELELLVSDGCSITDQWADGDLTQKVAEVIKNNLSAELLSTFVRDKPKSSLVDITLESQYRSSRVGGTGEIQRHSQDFVEIYAPAIKPNDWYVVNVKGLWDDGSENTLAKVIVKR